jgi:hypothetical protein
VPTISAFVALILSFGSSDGTLFGCERFCAQRWLQIYWRTCLNTTRLARPTDSRAQAIILFFGAESWRCYGLSGTRFVEHEQVLWETDAPLDWRNSTWIV